MAAWMVGPYNDVIEYRWFGRWSTPAWLDWYQARDRGIHPPRGMFDRAMTRLSDWLRRWAISMHDVDGA